MVKGRFQLESSFYDLQEIVLVVRLLYALIRFRIER